MRAAAITKTTPISALGLINTGDGYEDSEIKRRHGMVSGSEIKKGHPLGIASEEVRVYREL